LRKISRTGLSSIKAWNVPRTFAQAYQRFVSGETATEDGEMVISSTAPVKFSLTIHVGSKKKKRPNWALFFAIFSRGRRCAGERFSGLQAH
jgi:hypothetical protein